MEHAAAELDAPAAPELHRLVIRPLTVKELPLCVPMAQAFHAEMQVPGDFKDEVFLKNWRTFLRDYPAVILSLWKGEVLAGGIGGMVVPDLLDGRLAGHEFFWFMSPEHRVGTGAIRLLREFEAWAKSKGAVEIRMVHLQGKNELQLDRVYTKLGYKLQEVCYYKPLKG